MILPLAGRQTVDFAEQADHQPVLQNLIEIRKLNMIQAINPIRLADEASRPPETILVNVTPQETRVALLEENKVCELHIDRNSGHGLVGNIYLGVVKRVLPGMQRLYRHRLGACRLFAHRGRARTAAEAGRNPAHRAHAV